MHQNLPDLVLRKIIGKHSGRSETAIIFLGSNNAASTGFAPEITTPTITLKTEAVETTAGVVGPSVTTGNYT